ncbi:MAG: hypothetical protein P8Y63_10570 [Deltaproteobacteria bacterium]|jgi:hypothetical protein
MRKAFFQTIAVFRTALPILTGVLLLISLLNPILENQYARWFSGNYLTDPFIGAVAGSLSFGIPITSYIAGGELLAKGVSLLAVTAFIMTWTTVGLAMLPLEASFLGKRFALVRNFTNFFLAVAVAVFTIFILEHLP